jgi:hypothetical protein
MPLAVLIETHEDKGQFKKSPPSPQEIMCVANIENEVVAVAARKRLSVDSKSTVERETQDALACPSRGVNVLDPRERK